MSSSSLRRRDIDRDAMREAAAYPLPFTAGKMSKEEAEDHPIRMSDWKRVWVEAFHPSNASATD
jgi:hypothetical protein